MHLAVVIPVYNEERNVTALLRDWLPVFDAIGAPYRVILIDDGSTDRSPEVLKALREKDLSLSIYTQPNSGHGAAILRGYRMAVDAGTNADWVFQIDSDHQLETTAFRELWNNREHYDLLLAERKVKSATLARRCLSRGSRAIVRGLFGRGIINGGIVNEGGTKGGKTDRGITDVNTPYRLMRAARLREALEKIPDNSFAPNILLSAWFIGKKRRIFTTTTGLRGGTQHRKSKMNGYFLRGALKSALQTLLFRIR
jgi:dolichol-phosphate mannosyltransferase